MPLCCVLISMRKSGLTLYGIDNILGVSYHISLFVISTIVYITVSAIYKSRHDLLPPQFCNLFVLNSEVHLHDTRNKNLIHQVAHRINARALSIRVYWVKIWNALPTFIQNSTTFPI